MTDELVLAEINSTYCDTAEDILELCRQVKEIVQDKFGVTLEMEVKTMGDFS